LGGGQGFRGGVRSLRRSGRKEEIDLVSKEKNRLKNAAKGRNVH